MKRSLAAQVRAYLEFMGEDCTPTKLAAEVARHQRDLPEGKRCKRQNIEQLLAGDFRTVRYLPALAAAMGTTVETLHAGLFTPLGNVSLSNVEPGPDVRGMVPVISWIRAGEWCEITEPLGAADAESWLPCPAPHSPGTFALRVRGDSMTAPHGRSYPEGCLIYVDPERKSPINGERVVACLEGRREATFKIYKNEDGRQWLQPLNPTHEPIRETFHVLGTVIGTWMEE